MVQRAHVLHSKIAAYIEQAPEATMADARAFIAEALQNPASLRHRTILTEWQTLLESRSSQQIAQLLRSMDPATEPLRSSAPFCGAEIEEALR
jgi:hypothetical protein